MQRFHAVCRADAIAPGEGRLVEVDGRRIAVLRDGDRFFAIEDTCLHAGGPLHEGRACAGRVACPWHGWEFDLATGATAMNPYVRLAVFPVRVRDGWVHVAAGS